MAKMYYNLEEALAKLGLTEDKLKALVREGKLREFRDAGKLNYRVDEVDKMAAEQSAPLSLEDSGDIPLAPAEEEGSGQFASPAKGAGSKTGSGSGSGLSLDEGSGEFQLSDSGGGSSGLSLSDSSGSSGSLSLEDSGSSAGGLALGGSGSGTTPLSLEDSGGGSGAGLKLSDSGAGSDAGKDAVSLDEVDRSAVEGMKKDDTVITNIGISVFDDDDLEIAADPMAKTLMTGGDEHLGLDGSGGGSGLLDLTRESDDTSLGAELLEGIDMGDTAETEAATAIREPAAAPAAEEPEAVLAAAAEESFAPAVATVPMVVGAVEVASPLFTGLLVAGTIVLALLGAATVAMAVGVCPAYLVALTDQFWFFLGGCLLAGGIGALGGWLVEKQASRPRVPRPPKEKKDKKAKKGKAGGPAVVAG